MSLDADNTIQELVDQINLLTTQLASLSSQVEGLTSATISTGDLEDGSVTEPKLADGAVSEIKLADDSVSENKLINGAVTQDKLHAALYTALTRIATEAQTGRIEIASSAETLLGTDSTKAVPPAYLKAYVDSVLLAIRIPIGSLYFNGASNTNPNTILGYGTWSKFGEGRVPICIDGSQAAFDTMGETGGSSTAILGVNNLPAHLHGVPSQTVSTTTSGNHNHSTNINQLTAEGGDTTGLIGGNGNAPITPTTSSNGLHSHDVTIPFQNTQSTGVSDAFSIMSPYIVCAIWIRTA